MRTIRSLLIACAAGLVAAALACEEGEGIHLPKDSPDAGSLAPDAGEAPEVFPVAFAKPAKIMIVLDKSGSMLRKPEDSVFGCCTTGNGTTHSCVGYEPGGSCKWNSLKSLLLGAGGFLDQTADQARLGLAVFPHKNANTPDPATPGKRFDVCMDGYIPTPVASVAGESNQTIRDLLGGSEITPNGGTPTAGILELVAKDAEFMREEEATRRYVVLITDGLPNCNEQISDCRACTNTARPTDNPPCGGLLNCIDDERLVAAIKTLRTDGVDTFVIGFGADTDSDAAKAVLDEAAMAGGQAQSEDSPTRYYQAGSEADLQAILDKVSLRVQPCSFTLERAPASASGLAVSVLDTETEVERTLVRGTDWSYSADARVVTLLDDVSCASTAIDVANPPEHCWCRVLRGAASGRFVLKFALVGTP